MNEAPNHTLQRTGRSAVVAIHASRGPGRLAWALDSTTGI